MGIPAALGFAASKMWDQNKKGPSKTIRSSTSTVNNITNTNSHNAYGTSPLDPANTSARSTLLGG